MEKLDQDHTKGNDPYGESKPIAETEPTTDNTSGTGNPLTVTQTYYNIPISTANYGDAGRVLSNSTWYWVAARYVVTDSDYANFGLRNANTNMNGNNMFNSNNNSNNNNYRLRPVDSIHCGYAIINCILLFNYNFNLLLHKFL